MTYFKFIVEQLGSSEAAEKFCFWAFGENWGSASVSSASDLWNAQHSDLLVVKGADLPEEATKKMIDLYKEYGETTP